MRVDKEDMNRLKYLEREIENSHFKKVITSIIHNIEVNNIVYVIQEEGSWDYEFIGHTEVYSTFDEAFKAFKNLKKVAQTDMKEWIEKPEESELIDRDAEEASFEIYEDGDFPRLHDVITLKRKEVLVHYA